MLLRSISDPLPGGSRCATPPGPLGSNLLHATQRHAVVIITSPSSSSAPSFSCKTKKTRKRDTLTPCTWRHYHHHHPHHHRKQEDAKA